MIRIYYNESFPVENYFNLKDISRIETFSADAEIINPDYFWIAGLHKNRNIFSQSSLKNGASKETIKDFRLQLRIPKTIKDAVAEKQCKYIIDHSLEGFWDIDFSFIEELLECDRGDYIWLSGDYNIKTRYPNNSVQYVNFWERFTHKLINDNVENSHIYDDNITMANDKRIRDYYALYYNRRLREHRIALMAMMNHHKLNDDMIWSWGGRVDGRNLLHHGGMIKKVKKDWIQPTYNSSVDEIAKWENIAYGPNTAEDLNVNMVGKLNHVHIKSVYYHLIVETWATENKTTFLSEKSFKPFSVGQPFVIYGDAYTVSALRDMGYDVYDKWIDHSYDLVENPKKRAIAVLKEVERLNNKSLVEWAEMLYEMKSTLIFNSQHLKKSLCRNGVALFHK